MLLHVDVLRDALIHDRMWRLGRGFGQISENIRRVTFRPGDLLGVSHRMPDLKRRRPKQKILDKVRIQKESLSRVLDMSLEQLM